MPLMEEPFQRVVVDLVGPLEMSEGGNSYILTLVDLATRWAEATPLKHITSEHVAEALYGLFCRLGFPVEIQSDRGPQFISALMAEFDRFSGMKHIFSSPYRPQTNGSVERFHSSLKSILRKVTSDFPKQWDRYLPSALFAYRQMEHESTGFSPFFLLFGRKPRGPMALIADSFLTSTMAKPEFSYRYIHELHQCAREACHTARDALILVQQKSRDRQLPRSALKVFSTNDPVLVLLPDANNKLLMRLRGPFKIIERISSVNYRVQIDNRIVTLHVNLLRRYYPREVDNLESSTPEPKEALTFAAMSALIEEEDTTWVKPTVYTGPELNGQVDINPALSKEPKEEVLSILKEFPDVLTSKPGCTPTLEHSIKLKTEEPIFVKQYPLPFSAKKIIEEEVRSMLDLGVIEPSTSPYCSPVVLVKKKMVQ
ncbi:gypsy retrotransposon integrase-like protein 1 [Plakobranchus ocellatus]|uniref:Gypsy retrotransposon integrase-like protein 1 n=1 Tax=Plakobranchus ocellatus TaxID=259542 RepID=A0AAV3ZA70_9GAST|nr:gypsy retrotransposon integrase-like protein 1 [Plakobranchus ocellatus]